MSFKSMNPAIGIETYNIFVEKRGFVLVFQINESRDRDWNIIIGGFLTLVKQNSFKSMNPAIGIETVSKNYPNC